MAPEPNVTSLLREWRSGDDDALGQLTPMVYQELHRIAERHMRSERAGHTLQATALVNEAFVRMAEADVPWADRAHFFAVAARTMRRILTDYARSRLSAKRGAGVAAITLHEGLVPGKDHNRFIEIDEALTKLSGIDERKSDILVLHFFGGLTYEETAEALKISAATVDRDLRLAKAWLASELGNH
jgi:RNA polymerase sigma factor (TIGR02999 family)